MPQGGHQGAEGAHEISREVDQCSPRHSTGSASRATGVRRPWPRHHDHDHGGPHGHTHGVIDPTIATTARGIWAIKWSFVILAITALLQLVVVVASGSVALLADTIHNIGDATTAIPLWIAFVLARRKPTRLSPTVYGRVEDLAGIAIVADHPLQRARRRLRGDRPADPPAADDLTRLGHRSPASSALSATRRSPCSASGSGAR